MLWVLSIFDVEPVPEALGVLAYLRNHVAQT